MPHAQSFDTLSALAPLFRVQPELQVLCRFGEPWASRHAHEPAGWVPFHLVTAGRCMLAVDGEPPTALGAGDIVLLPHGDAHVVRGASRDRNGSAALPVRLTRTPTIDVRCNSDDPDAELICGRLTFEQPQQNLARAALPRLIVLRTAEDASVARLHALLIAIRDELDAAAPGALAISTDLASALLVMVLRLHFQRHPAEHGLLRLLGEPHTARALAAMLEDPARAWTLDTLADRAGTSRATLVRDMRRLAGETPFGVLAEVRLGLARHRLVASDRPMADIAAEAGYASPSAFSRAIQRRFGIAPGALRRQRDEPAADLADGGSPSFQPPSA